MKNWKSHIISFLFGLGFLLLPTLTYACNDDVKSVQATAADKTEFNQDLKKSNSTFITRSYNKIDKSSDDCDCGKGCPDGKCSDMNCKCSLSCSFFLFIPASVQNIQSHNFSDNKQNILYKGAFISSGFSFVWLPPKIG
ncbi:MULTISPECIES: hypothetical protein [Chryseobacterium]|uniref:Lipoprotein n=1 Tax=Chryseobacterium aquaticum subsp. greenlandense TaxID=345663 RepID=A0A117KBT0_9FLAO|nr:MULTISPECIES: hypothetical protein [Chryseobacterium]KNB61174.1 hypothetical protein AC804_11345 [Chryseobacterium sp. Hurlbut01]KUJ56370.1 hypothetical protein AR686_07345 [Chryseobacterium aquaticum subsp. greenlandense]